MSCALARALLPLLRSPKLKVWSKLVMDVATAKELLTLAEQQQPEADNAAESSFETARRSGG